MAEFSEVMRQFDRMCKAHGGCVDCPLAVKGTGETKCSIGSFIDESEYVEQEIMRWAADHPELVYPAWRDWLRDLYGNPNMTMTDILESPIDPEIAQRLNILHQGERNSVLEY